AGATATGVGPARTLTTTGGVDRPVTPSLVSAVVIAVVIAVAMLLREAIQSACAAGTLATVAVTVFLPAMLILNLFLPPDTRPFHQVARSVWVARSIGSIETEYPAIAVRPRAAVASTSFDFCCSVVAA